MSNLRALVVTYQFPPTGGAGVGRALKLVKYLPRCGVDTAVLTVANPSVPVRDPTLAIDVPEATRIIRTPTLEPGYALKRVLWRMRTTGTPFDRGDASAPAESDESGAPAAVVGPVARRQRALAGAALSAAQALLVPDPQVLWQPGAVLGLVGATRFRPDVVLITAPPFSQFLLAPLIRLWGRPKLVFDYRDEWSTCRETFEMSSAVQRRLGAALEKALVNQAHAIVVATDGFRNNLLDRFACLAPERVVSIPNGYDPDDFPSQLPAPPTDRFTITYAGTVFRLTRPSGFLRALRRLNRDYPELAGRLRVRFVGRIVDSELAAFEGADALGIELLGYRSKAESLRLSSASHMTLCTLDDMPEARHIYPGKIFELMYLQRPCLTIGPRGEMTRLARRHELGPVLTPDDDDAMVALLVDRLERFTAGTLPPPSAATNIERYHRANLAREFAEVFLSLTRPPSAGATS